MTGSTARQLWIDHPRWRRRLVRSAVAGAILVAVLLAIPLGIERYAEGWLRAQGASAADIGNVDLNPFTGVLRVEALDAGADEQQRLSAQQVEVNLQWLALARGRLHIEGLHVHGVRADVRPLPEGGIAVGGLRFPPRELEEAVEGAEEVDPSDDAWGLGSETVQLEDIVVTWADTQLDTEFHLQELALGPHATWRPADTTDLRIDMTIDGSALRLSSDVAPWSDEPRLTGSLRLQELDLRAYETLLAAAGISDPRGRLSADLELALVDDGTHFLLDATGPLELAGAEVGDGTNRVHEARLHWDGTLGLAWPPDATRQLATAEGDFRVEGVSVALPDLGIETALAEAHWNGSLRFSPADEDAGITLTSESSLEVRGLHVDHPELGLRLLEIAGISVEGVAIASPQRLSVAETRIDGLTLLDEQAGVDTETDSDSVLAIERIEARDLDADLTQRVELAEVIVTRPRVRVVREADGSLQRIDAVQRAFMPPESDEPETAAPTTDSAATENTENTEGAAEPALAFAIRTLRISGDDWLRFQDRSLAAPVTIGLDALAIELGDIDTAAAAPMQIDVMTAQGEGTQIRAQGTAHAFATPMDADIQLDVTNIDLPQISPFVPGYNIERGRLTSDTQAVLDNGRLDVTNNLLIERLQLAGKQDNALVAQGAAMPLDVALDLLRNGDDEIRLELPITGSLADPQFGTGAVFRRAVQGALQKAAFSYVKNALQPLGTILFVKDLATAAARPRFEPVELPPGSAELPEAARAYLGKIGAMLGDRPKLQLTMCGVATARDREALLARAQAEATANAAPDSTETTETTETAGTAEASETDEAAEPLVTETELVQLAQLRTAAALRFLTESAGIQRARLFACRDTYENEDAQPRVEITL